LTYIVAFAHDEVVDVTRRYTRNYADVLSRRTTVRLSLLSLCMVVQFND